MDGKLQRLESAAMGRPIHLWRFGHYGVPLLVLPSSAGLAHEWEYNGILEGLRPLIEGGALKLYCTESNVSQTWMHQDDHPRERIARHRQFERYILDELVPLIREDCQTADIRIAVAGTSLGALYSATLVLKHPEIFFYGLCVSGKYDSTWLTGGYSDDEIYYDNPMAFVPNLEGLELARVQRHVSLDLVCGLGAFEGRNAQSTADLAEVLERKQIDHTVDFWRGAGHQPRWWAEQIRLYLDRRFGLGGTAINA